MKMSLTSRKELVKKAKGRYLKATKLDKVLILDELSKNTGLARNYLIQILSAKVDLDYVNSINRKRRVRYDANVVHYLKKIWTIFDYPCGQRLEPMMLEYVSVLERFKEVIIPDSVKEKVLKIKSATIDRRLEKFRPFRHK